MLSDRRVERHSAFPEGVLIRLMALGAL